MAAPTACVVWQPAVNAAGYLEWSYRPPASGMDASPLAGRFAGKPGGSFRLVTPPAGDFPPEESHQSPPGFANPGPHKPAAVRHRRAGKGVSCRRLGKFLRGCRCVARIMRLREFDSSCRRRCAKNGRTGCVRCFGSPRSTRPGTWSGHAGPGKWEGHKPFGSTVCRDAGQQRLLCRKPTGAHAGSHCGPCWHQVRRFGNRIPAAA